MNPSSPFNIQFHAQSELFTNARKMVSGNSQVHRRGDGSQDEQESVQQECNAQRSAAYEHAQSSEHIEVRYNKYITTMSMTDMFSNRAGTRPLVSAKDNSML